MMNAKPIRTRQDLIDLIALCAPSRSCERSIAAGRVEVLGGFTSAGGLPCWIVRIQSRRGRTWIIALNCDEKDRRYQAEYLDSVPWLRWIGTSKGTRPLIDGDHPTEYAFRRLTARRYGTTQTPTASTVKEAHDDIGGSIHQDTTLHRHHPADALQLGEQRREG